MENFPSPNRSRSLDRNKFISSDKLCPLPESLEFDVKYVFAFFKSIIKLLDNYSTFF